MKRRILVLINVLALILCLSSLPLIFADLDIAASDSSALPNNGVEMTIQCLYQPGGNLAMWTSDLMANNIWVQFGYITQHISSSPNVYQILPTVDVFNMSDKSGYNNFPPAFAISGSSSLWHGPKSFDNGTFHTFSFEFTSESQLSFYVDNSLAMVLTPSYVSQWLVSSGQKGDITEFSTVSDSTYPVILGEEWSNSVTQNIDIPLAIGILQNSVWHTASSAHTYGSEIGTGLGVKGQLQDSSLKIGQVVIGSSISSLGDNVVLWSGSTKPIALPSPTGLTSQFSKTDILAITFSFGAVGSIGAAIYVTLKKPKHRR